MGHRSEAASQIPCAGCPGAAPWLGLPLGSMTTEGAPVHGTVPSCLVTPGEGNTHATELRGHHTHSVSLKVFLWPPAHPYAALPCLTTGPWPTLAMRVTFTCGACSHVGSSSLPRHGSLQGAGRRGSGQVGAGASRDGRVLTCPASQRPASPAAPRASSSVALAHQALPAHSSAQP